MKAPTVTGFDQVKPDRLYTINDVIALTGWVRTTVYRRRDAGKLPLVRLGGTWRILGVELRRLGGLADAPPEPTETAKQRDNRAAEAVARMWRAKS